ncbi:hypothetical protein RRG08_048277 [Elysia crispata]|uniref:Uncharacterized protein n=1 Tax=Elysia crispata TaxID=231223 RepID=A0AAE1DLN6_9GAST|nr:hypothetical protein RRG08_048277 [Elysia crispata]
MIGSYGLPKKTVKNQSVGFTTKAFSSQKFWSFWDTLRSRRRYVQHSRPTTRPVVILLGDIHEELFH